VLSVSGPRVHLSGPASVLPPRGSFWGLIPPKQKSKSPPIFRVSSPPRTNPNPPRRNAPYWKLSGDGSALPTCLVVYIQKSDLINVLCVAIVKNVLCLAQALFSYFVLHSSKIPLMLTLKVTHLQNLLFRQPDGVNCVARRVYLAVIAKLSQSRIAQLVDYGC